MWRILAQPLDTGHPNLILTTHAAQEAGSRALGLQRCTAYLQEPNKLLIHLGTNCTPIRAWRSSHLRHWTQREGVESVGCEKTGRRSRGCRRAHRCIMCSKSPHDWDIRRAQQLTSVCAFPRVWSSLGKSFAMSGVRTGSRLSRCSQLRTGTPSMELAAASTEAYVFVKGHLPVWYYRDLLLSKQRQPQRNTNPVAF